MAVRLSKRLTALAELVTEGKRLADIGTDHGYIPIFLCLQGRIPSAIAMDINAGPLERAREHVLEYGLSSRIEIRLSDGLQKLYPGEADTILIAGMGGGLVIKILSEGGQAITGKEELVLQPQSEIAKVRQYLREQGFVIVDEDMVEEEGKFYPMMRAHKVSGDINAGHPDSSDGEDAGKRYQELCDNFGPVLLMKKHPVLLKWMEREQNILLKILQQLEKQPASDQIESRRQEILSKKILLTEALDIIRK